MAGHRDGAYRPWDREAAAAIIAAHAGPDGGMQHGPALPILHDMQAAFGFIPDDAIPLLAEALNVTRAEMHGVVTFYHDFRRHPPGRHVLRLCRAEACQSMGADSLAAHVMESLGVSWHGTTADGSVTLEPVFCLGLCACAPAAMLDGEPLGRLDAARLDDHVREMRFDSPRRPG